MPGEIICTGNGCYTRLTGDEETCPDCGTPVGEDLEQTPQSLSMLGVNSEAEALLAQIDRLVDDLDGAASGRGGVLIAREEVLLERLLTAVAGRLDGDQWDLIDQQLRKDWLAPAAFERQTVVRHTLRAVLDSLKTGATRPDCRAPVRAIVTLDPNASPGHVQVVVQLESRLPHPLRAGTLRVEPDAELGTIRFARTEQQVRLMPYGQQIFRFQGNISAPGPVSLPLKLRLSCARAGNRPLCQCCFGTELHWTITRDSGNQYVIHQNTVEFSGTIDTALIRPQFQSAPVEPDSPAEDRPPIQFEVDLSLDIDRLRERVDRSARELPSGQEPALASHLRVTHGDVATVVVVLLGQEVTLGRSHTNHIVTRYGKLNQDEDHWGLVSRQHARLRWDPRTRRPLIEQLGSVNSTTVLHRSMPTVLDEGKSTQLIDGNVIDIPSAIGAVTRPYELKLRIFQHQESGGARRPVCLTLTPLPTVHDAIQRTPPYKYVWLPEADSEALVGGARGLPVHIPGLGRKHAFRLLRDEEGQVRVMPCAGETLTLDRDDEPLAVAPLSHRALESGDVIHVEGAELTYLVHQGSADPQPQLGRCYRGPRGAFQVPDGFRLQMLPLLVVAE